MSVKDVVAERFKKLCKERNIKINELAKIVSWESKRVMSKLNEMGIYPRSLESEITEEQAESFYRRINFTKGGKEKALMSLFGKCMKELKGNCDPQVLRTILIDYINKQ